MKTDDILSAFRKDTIMKTHAYNRMRDRNISIHDVEEAIESDELIEDYPDDFPLPSGLLLGFTKADVALHIVCSPTKDGLILITAYLPDEDKWKDGFAKRKNTRIE